MEPTSEQLKYVFKNVCDENDWKEPIIAIIDKNDWEIVRKAIVFMTATLPVITAETAIKYSIYAEGYRLGPAGDH